MLRRHVVLHVHGACKKPAAHELLAPQRPDELTPQLGRVRVRARARIRARARVRVKLRVKLKVRGITRALMEASEASNDCRGTAKRCLRRGSFSRSSTG
jgi:hypothetical protein